MKQRILVTLGPSSMNMATVKEMTGMGVHLFRINLSHTPLAVVAETIRAIRSWTTVPVCIDSEGAQIRNQRMADPPVTLTAGDRVRIHFSEVVGDRHNLSFTPAGVAAQLAGGDALRIDFDSASLQVIERHHDHCIAEVTHGGRIGANKAVDLDREIPLPAITPKDREAIAIAREMGVRHFALSFAGGPGDVAAMRTLIGEDAVLISKVESATGLMNLAGIIAGSDAILIDRGDLSRQIPIEKIPFLQRRIVAAARAAETPVYVATNLLESMVTDAGPTRAEVNDVVSTLLMGATGLVLAAETAVGRHPAAAVEMVRRLMSEAGRWTPNSSVDDILGGGTGNRQRARCVA